MSDGGAKTQSRLSMNETSGRGFDAPIHVILQLVDESGKAGKRGEISGSEKDYATNSTPFRASRGMILVHGMGIRFHVGWMINAMMRVLIESLFH